MNTGRNIRIPNIMADPGSDGPLECRTLGVSDHGSGGPKPSVVLVGIQCQFDSPSPSVSILRQMVQFLQSSQVKSIVFLFQTTTLYTSNKHSIYMHSGVSA